MIKVKELKDDAIIDIKVNKSFYLMLKAASFHVLQGMNIQEIQQEGYNIWEIAPKFDLQGLRETYVNDEIYHINEMDCSPIELDYLASDLPKNVKCLNLRNITIGGFDDGDYQYLI